MFTPPPSFHSPSSYRWTGSGLSAGRSSFSKADRRHPSSFWNGRALSFSSSSQIAAFSSSRLKKRRLRRQARIHRCAINTPPSTFALSFGLRGRAGTTAVM
jgi:hypothetical protein